MTDAINWHPNGTPGPWSVVDYDCGDAPHYDHNGSCPSIQAPDNEDCAIVHWDGFKQKYWSACNGNQRQIETNARAAIAAMPDREAAYEDGYNAGELKWAEAMDKQIGIEESLRTQLAASQADVARLREALAKIASCKSHTPGDVVHIAQQTLARAAIKDTQP